MKEDDGEVRRYRLEIWRRDDRRWTGSYAELMLANTMRWGRETPSFRTNNNLEGSRQLEEGREANKLILSNDPVSHLLVSLQDTQI